MWEECPLRSTEEDDETETTYTLEAHGGYTTILMAVYTL